MQIWEKIIYVLALFLLFSESASAEDNKVNINIYHFHKVMHWSLQAKLTQTASL
jgi:hypothetical protein